MVLGRSSELPLCLAAWVPAEHSQHRLCKDPSSSNVRLQLSFRFIFKKLRAGQQGSVVERRKKFLPQPSIISPPNFLWSPPQVPPLSLQNISILGLFLGLHLPLKCSVNTAVCYPCGCIPTAAPSSVSNSMETRTWGLLL